MIGVAVRVTDSLVRNNESYSRSFAKGDLPLPPAKHLAVLAGMDARLDVHKILCETVLRLAALSREAEVGVGMMLTRRLAVDFGRCSSALCSG
jgi:hypothetical protein